MKLYIALFFIICSLNCFSQDIKKEKENARLKKKVETNKILIEDLVNILQVKDSISKKKGAKIVYIKIYDEPIRKYVVVDTVKQVEVIPVNTPISKKKNYLADLKSQQ